MLSATKHQVVDTDCDTILSEFRWAQSTIHGTTFDREKERIDVFWSSRLADRNDLAHLWSIVQQLCILSHGQSMVERGFSTNKEILTEYESANDQSYQNDMRSLESCKLLLIYSNLT